MIEQTFIIFKPDVVKRQFVGEILSRFEKVGLKIVALKMLRVTSEFSKVHYNNVINKPFYHGLENYITEGPVIAGILEGVHAVEIVRKLLGETEPQKSMPGTIRGDYGHHSREYIDTVKVGHAIKNILHASSSIEAAKKEIALWFKPEEIMNYKTVHEEHTL